MSLAAPVDCGFGLVSRTIRAAWQACPSRAATILRSRSIDSAPRNDGFSLVEILCAVLILGVALTGMIQGVTTALSSNKESELQTVAALFAAGQIETLRAEGGLRDGAKDGDCGEGLSQYRWQQTISPAGVDGLHEVTVAVESSRSGKTIYELKTLLFELPQDTRSTSTSTRKEGGAQARRSGTR
jgi:prepilin-type N-terminal cleavage/methylation domain-containing protein